MAKTNPAEFIREVRQEAAKVTWPTRKETVITLRHGVRDGHRWRRLFFLSSTRSLAARRRS